MTQNSPDNKKSFGGLLKGLQRKVIARIVLVALTIILTVVLVFSLTVAWQTNVVQMGGLSFSAESFNFSGEVLLDDRNIVMTPGDSGTIPLKLINDSESLVAASVTVSKEQMNAAQNKIYFYIDTPQMRNGELLDRVYVSSKKSYTYTMFPFSELTLDEKTVNQPNLKWEWVYDTLGYYVLGRATDNGGVVIEDYLFPIEYEYDELLTTFDENGELKTIDGIVGVEEFLTEVSSKDGYVGKIDISRKTAGGYYPVSVVDGYGVWAYLCNYSEIQIGISEDTSLGNSSAALGKANILVTGQNSREEGVLVYSEESFTKALSTSGISIVTLNNDIDLTQAIVTDINKKVMVDLNGHTITSSADTIVDAQSGGEIMLYNGNVEGISETNIGVTSTGGAVTLNKINISNVSEGIAIFDHKDSNGLDSTVHLIDCNIVGDLDGLWIYGNGGKSERLAEIVIENSNIVGENYAGIICNGTQYGTDIKISNSEIYGYYTAIFFPQKNSYLSIDKCTLTGITGMAIKGGYVNVNNSVITGTGAPQNLPEDPEDVPMSGWLDTGDGVYLETNYTDRETVITIMGEETVIKCTHADSKAVRMFPTGSTYAQAQIKILGGSFNTDVSDYLADGYVTEETDGMYVVNPE